MKNLVFGALGALALLGGELAVLAAECPALPQSYPIGFARGREGTITQRLRFPNAVFDRAPVFSSGEAKGPVDLVFFQISSSKGLAIHQLGAKLIARDTGETLGFPETVGDDYDGTDRTSTANGPSVGRDTFREVGFTQGGAKTSFVLRLNGLVREETFKGLQFQALCLRSAEAPVLDP
jgi:hypothetical protein